MKTEIKVWQVEGEDLREIQEDDLAAQHQERELESWVERNPDLLGSRLLVISRQFGIPNVGRVDLLCMDQEGRLVVVEFKRDLTSREAVAQALDYASWLNHAPATEINSSAAEYLGQPLADAYFEYFGTELEALDPEDHCILVVAPKLDSSAERIINYLAERHGVRINAIFFRYARTRSGDSILIRTVLVPDAPRIDSTRPQRLSIEQLLAGCEDELTRQRLKFLIDKWEQLGHSVNPRTRGASFAATISNIDTPIFWAWNANTLQSLFGTAFARGNWNVPSEELVKYKSAITSLNLFDEVSNKNHRVPLSSLSEFDLERFIQASHVLTQVANKAGARVDHVSESIV
jgi:hypothetical protein